MTGVSLWRNPFVIRKTEIALLHFMGTLNRWILSSASYRPQPALDRHIRSKHHNSLYMALQLSWGFWCWDRALHFSLPSMQLQQLWGLPQLHVPLLLHSLENTKMSKLLLNIRTGKGQVEMWANHPIGMYIWTSVLRISKQGRYLSNCILPYQTNGKEGNFYILRLGSENHCNSRLNM